MTLTHTVLLELGCEELPFSELIALSRQLQHAAAQQFTQARLDYVTLEVFVTPRRLALLVNGLAITQRVQEMVRRGPWVAQAFDVDNQPTAAAQGFARSCNVDIGALQREQGSKGARLVLRQTQPGNTARVLLPTLLKQIITVVKARKSMRWKNSGECFARPVRWLVALCDEDIIELSLFGLQADRNTYGHRALAPKPIMLEHAGVYPDRLQSLGYVVPSWKKRQRMIHDQVQCCAQQVSGEAEISDQLLDQVTALVETPQALIGSFDARFLALPEAVLRAVMIQHQKYFPLHDATGKLLPHFIFVANLTGGDPQPIIAGNERVIRPRLEDAWFFYHQDRKKPLIAYQEMLKHVVYVKELGDMYARSERIAALATIMAQTLNLDVAPIQEAAQLCKSDLVTRMVQEFPQLQGLMGGDYARREGRSATVAEAIASHYQPRSAQHPIPAGIAGRIIACADRMDSLCGLFLLQRQPTANADPYGLRRAALGLIRIISQSAWEMDLHDWVLQGFKLYAGTVGEPQTASTRLREFLHERLLHWWTEAGYHPAQIRAAARDHTLNLMAIQRRLDALALYLSEDRGKTLIAMYKRITRLRKDAAIPIAALPLPTLETADQALLRAYQRCSDAFGSQAPEQNLQLLLDLQPVLNRFFDQVMVLCEETALRNWRLRMLTDIRELFLRIADFDQL